ncbi:McrB family protein [Leeuwenhoekiella sp. A16]|uniref:McrB family protein n=1 Tax=Leeuwenhoekiella sp. A16 TaxID=3141462 RepID=UPI003A8095B1
MTKAEIKVWKSTINTILLENESWENKNRSDRYHIVFKDIRMPPKVVYARAYDHIQLNHPEIKLTGKGGGIPTNIFLEELGFHILENLKFNKTDGAKLKGHIEQKIKYKEFFHDFINFGSSVLADLNVEIYKVKMTIESDNLLSIVMGKRTAYSYIEDGSNAIIGFLVSKTFKERYKDKYDFAHTNDYQDEPYQSLVTIRVKKWSEIDQELLQEHKKQFELQYLNIKDAKITQWKVEPNTTNNALKHILFKHENIKDFMSNTKTGEKIISLGNSRIYKLSMGTFLKDYNKTGLIERFEEKQWAVMGAYTARNQGKNWMNQAKVGDYAYITYGKDKLGGLIQITSEPKDLPADVDSIIGNDEFKYREYDIIALPIIDNTRKVKGQKGWMPSGYSTFKEIQNLDEANQILFKPYFNVEIISENSRNKSKNPEIKPSALNQILYGPPGTGKTYTTKELAVKIADPYFGYNKVSNISKRKQITQRYEDLVKEGQIVFTTFHQSYGYEDFVEGIKPEVTGTDINYTVKNGLFKSLCEQAELIDDNNIDSAIIKFQEKIEKEGVQELKTSRGSKFTVDYSGGKTFRINPSSSEKESPLYPASIEYIKKLYMGRDITSGLYNPSYVKSILEHLVKTYGLSEFNAGKENVSKNYVLIIDEINRGNISAIFGELITLLEPDKRKNADEAVLVTLPYSGDSFGVPENVYIIGTMNTADRSVEALDTALRRRFSFKEVMPKPFLLSPAYEYWDLLWKYKDVDWEDAEYKNKEKCFFQFYKVDQDFIDNRKAIWKSIEDLGQKDEQVKLFKNFKYSGIRLDKILKTINKRIEALLDRDHTIGHSYFLKIIDAENKEEALKQVFKDNIIPLLQEYFYGDYRKIGLVLGDGFVQSVPLENRAVFAKFNNGNNDVEILERYELKHLQEDFKIIDALGLLLENA